jgi:hypothetical protein
MLSRGAELGALTCERDGKTVRWLDAPWNPLIYIETDTLIYINTVEL